MTTETSQIPEIIKNESSFYDTHHIISRSDGGEYHDENLLILDPIEHMKEHGNYRERDENLDNLKNIIDERVQIMKIEYKISNQIIACERRVDKLNSETLEWLTTVLKTIDIRKTSVDKKLKTSIKEIAKIDPFVSSALGVKGLGEVTIAYCLTYIDLEKARHASSLWSYVGLDKPAKDRHVKGQKGGGNKTLRTALYTFADSQMRSKSRKIPSAYAYIYDEIKNRLENSDKLVISYVPTKKKWMEVMWKDASKGHRHSAALRKIMKVFLADYWIVGRTFRGLPTDLPYAEAILGKNHKTISPTERGWKY